ncbi:MAG: LamG domain-containing protein, partial [Candidatus Bathyarchaeia archaeon]
DSNSTPAENVWDSNFVFVSHMQDNPDNAHIRDSTQNNNDGTKRNANEPIEENGKTAKAQNFDGTDDYITRSATPSLNLPTAWTLSAWLYIVTNPTFCYIITRNTDTLLNAQYGYYLRTPQTGGRWGALHNGDFVDVAPIRTWPMQTWVYTVMTWNGTHLQAYYNGAQDGSPVARSGTATDQGNWFNIGRRSNSLDGTSSAGLFGGRIDEARVSNIARSPAWIKATYESEIDNLIAYGNEETGANYNDALRIANQVANNWEINLKIYNSTNINRISNLNINLHDGNSTNQITIKEGVIAKSEGEPHNLAGQTTMYISINNLKANATGTSHIHVYLKIKVPNTSTYTLLIITFEIT